MNLLLETIPETPEPHASILKSICQSVTAGENQDLLLEKLESDTTLVREQTSRLLGESQQISAPKLFQKLQAKQANKTQIIDILEMQQNNLPPELFVKNALKLDREYATRLLDIATNQAKRTDMSNVDLDIQALENPDVKLRLLAFLAAVDQPDAALIMTRFLGDKSRVVVMKTLDLLKTISTSFNPEQLIQFMMKMSESDQEKAFEVLRSHVDDQNLSALSVLMTGKSDELRKKSCAIVAEKANDRNLEHFLLALDRHEWWGKDQAIKCLSGQAGKVLPKAAAKLIDHDNEFVKEAANQLSVGFINEVDDLQALEKAATNDDWQVRDRAVEQLGKSGKPAALAILKRVLSVYPESAVAVLKAIGELGFSKGLELASQCLKMKEAAVQREALMTISRIVNKKHADAVRTALIKFVPKLQVTVRDTAREVIDDITQRFSLSQLNLDEATFFETRLLKVNENNQASNIATEEPTQQIYQKTEVVSFQSIEELKSGDVWMDRYEITREIGRGAMGRVMLVEDKTVDERLILKFMHPELTADVSAKTRFLRELKYARKISHPNVIRIHDYLLHQGISAISMEYFESSGLDDLIKKSRLISLEQRLKILDQVSRGMKAAHDQQVIHRDLKPSNVLVNDEDLAKVVDFGIASATSETEKTLTKTGMIIGTPAYLAPERAKGQEADNRSDIYALGIIAYTMFNGKLPYHGEPVSLLLQHIEGKAPPLHSLNKSIPVGVSMLVQKMMAVDIEQRYQHMGEVSQTIQDLL